MQKIAIFGPIGAGKSTLAIKLDHILGIEPFHMDYHFWQSGWKRKPKDERIEILIDVLQKEKWIIEGAYFTTLDRRLAEADTIIFLDIPNYICVWRVILRHITSMGRPRPDIPEGCTDKLSLPHLWGTFTFPWQKRQELLEKLDDIKKKGGKEVRQFHTKKQVDDFLQECAVKVDNNMKVLSCDPTTPHIVESTISSAETSLVPA